MRFRILEIKEEYYPQIWLDTHGWAYIKEGESEAVCQDLEKASKFFEFDLASQALQELNDTMLEGSLPEGAEVIDSGYIASDFYLV